jgi:hypothetical protein
MKNISTSLFIITTNNVSHQGMCKEKETKNPQAGKL